MTNKEFILEGLEKHMIEYNKLNKVYIATNYIGEHWSDKIVKEFDTKEKAIEYLSNSLKNKAEKLNENNKNS